MSFKATIKLIRKIVNVSIKIIYVDDWNNNNNNNNDSTFKWIIKY